MQGIINERKGLPFPLPCLRLLVPPLWLASAAIWQTVQKRVVMNYGMLEEFVTMVTEIVPELLSHRQRAQLILGLRAQLILELCRSNSTADLQNIQSHLDRMQTLTPLWRTEASDADVGLFESNFLGLIQTLLKDPEEKQHFFQDVFPVKFGPGYDTAIQTLMWQFLSRLEKLLPQKNLQQVASLLSNVPSVLEECVESVSHSQQLKTLLQYHRDLGQLDGDDTPSDGGCIFSALCHPPVERVMITNKQSQSETHTLLDSFSNELEVEVATVTEHKEIEIGTSMDVKEEEGEREESSIEEECKKNNKRSLEKNGEEPEHSAEFGDTLEHVVNVEPMDGQTVVLDRSGFDAGNEEVACVGIRPREGETEDGGKKVMVIGEDGMVISPEMMMDNKMMIDIKNPSVQLQRISTTNMLLPLASRPVRRNRGLKMKRFLLQERKATKIKPSKSVPKRPSPTHRISNQDNICDLCGKMFSRYADVIRHQRTHPGNCPYQCLKCKKRFQDSSGLREHQLTLCVGQDKAPKQFKCTSCEWIFGSSSQIKSHMKSHSNERPYQCCNCESTFKHLSSMKAHEEACLFASQQRSEVPSGGSNSPPATGQNDPETSSSTLQKPSLEENDMESSSKVQLNSTPVDNGTEGPSHQCPLCRKSFLRPNDLLIHQQIICEAETSEPEKSQRLSHANTLGKVGQSQRAKESLTRRTCPVCSKILQRPALMEKHMRTHTNSEGHTDGVGPYHCLYCEKIYKYALNLKKHNEICRKNTPPSQSGPPASDESDQGPFCSIVQKQSLEEASDAFLQTTAKDSDLSTSAPQGPSYLSVTKRPKHFRSCRVCGKNIVGYMKYHMRSHSEKRPHCCPHCGLKFKFDFGLRRHMRQFCKVRREDPVEESNAMKKRKMSKCDECGKEFGLKSTLKAHKLTHNPLYCAECRKVCPDLEMLSVHNLKHKPVQCTMCEKSFNVTRFLSKHYQDVHEFSGPFVCTHCHKSYSDLGAFIRHERTHTGDLPFQCSHCPKGFNWYQTLVTHERKHTGEKPYLCWECGKAFGSKGVLEKHMACRHIPQEKPLSCPQCEKTFWTKTSLNHHVDTHHKGVRYPCSYCGKLFFSPSALVRHDLIHTGERPFSCTYNDCDKTFKSNSELKIHMRYHTGERPFKCKVCGKGFVQAHYLTTHQRSHTKERPYACTLCDKAFTTGNQLKRHRMVHTGEKPYKCLECDKAFSRRHRLQDHQEKYQHTNCT